MEQLVSVSGIAAPLLRINIDTDQIAPGPEGARARKEGWAGGLFGRWRYLKDRSPNPDFVLNQEPYTRAKILLADRNFGCGSSRETAPEALRAWGLRAVIAPSFGGIFFNNCFRNGLVPVEMGIEDVRLIAADVEASKGLAELTVDLKQQIVTAPSGKRIAFKTPVVLREMLLSGTDEIDLTLSHRAEISAFRDKDRQLRPWIYDPARKAS
jgi:3-isopropylmalate/(R)-2-methylmalate dehydratase small subunit